MIFYHAQKYFLMYVSVVLFMQIMSHGHTRRNMIGQSICEVYSLIGQYKYARALTAVGIECLCKSSLPVCRHRCMRLGGNVYGNANMVLVL